MTSRVDKRRRALTGAWAAAAATAACRDGFEAPAAGEATGSPRNAIAGFPSRPAPPSGDVPQGQATHPVFPLRIQPGKRHLTDASGKPFLLHGDSPWSLIVQLRRDEVDEYLNDRRGRGFNTLLVNLIEHKFAQNAPRNAYGQGPFTTDGDYGTPNEQYFAHADWVLRRAAQSGFLVLLVPSYLGYDGGDEGWYRVMRANGPAKLRRYGRWLGKRYAGFKNILWMHGGDYNPPDRSVVREVAAGIREFDRRLGSAHCGPETAGAEYWAGESWLQLNTVYTYKTVYSAALAQYERADRMPFIYLEGGYENGLENDPSIDPIKLRTQAWQAMLCGAAGQLYGNNPVWHFNAPTRVNSSGLTWRQSLDLPGARSMAHLRNVLAARAWWTLVPDLHHRLLTAGLGTGLQRAVAARAADGSFALAYLPAVRDITLDLGQMRGPRVSARWLDPATGRVLAAADGPVAAEGHRVLRPGGINGGGGGDWVLVLETAP